jgi:hypothetical protein
MAGAPAGYRTFAAGEVLTAANVQTYLQDQVVSVYANEAAADAALASPAEGQFRWISDVDLFQVYDGSAWGAAGGGAAGSVLQVVSTTKTDAFTTTSASLTDITGLSVSITPRSTSSKILVLASFGARNATTVIDKFQLVRDSTAIAVSTGGSTTNGTWVSVTAQGGGDQLNHMIAINHLDSPATTSSTTYKVQCSVGGGTMYVGRTVAGNYGQVSSITVMEIAG